MDISLQLDKNSSVPLYQQVYRQLRPLILNGAIPAGSRLPATRRLAAVHSIARVTVLQAYEQLEVEGFVEGRAGAGTYVAHDLPVNGRYWPLPEEPEPFLPTFSPWGSRLVKGASSIKEPSLPPEIDFSLNRSHCPTFPYDSWRRILGRHLGNDDSHLSHPDAVAGFGPLRQAVADYVTRLRGVNCCAEQVVIVSGIQQALDILGRLLLAPGDEVLVETPGQWAVHNLFRSHGARLQPLPVAADGFPVQLIAPESQARLALVTPAHQFPRGGAMPLPQRLALLAWAKRQQALIIEDDSDGELRYAGRPLTALQGLDKEGHVVHVGSFSKLMFPGLRLGYVVLPPSLKRPFLHAKQLLDDGAASFTQAALVDFMCEGHFEAHLRQLRRAHQEGWHALAAALDTHLGDRVRFSRVAAGRHVLVELDEGVDEAALVRETAVCGVGVTAGAAYHLQKPAPPSILLGFGGITGVDIEEGVRRIAMALDQASR